RRTSTQPGCWPMTGSIEAAPSHDPGTCWSGGAPAAGLPGAPPGPTVATSVSAGTTTGGAGGVFGGGAARAGGMGGAGRAVGPGLEPGPVVEGIEDAAPTVVVATGRPLVALRCPLPPQPASPVRARTRATHAPVIATRRRAVISPLPAPTSE